MEVDRDDEAVFVAVAMRSLGTPGLLDPGIYLLVVEAISTEIVPNPFGPDPVSSVYWFKLIIDDDAHYFDP